MARRQPTHPFAPLLLALLVVAVLAALYELFGLGERTFQLAVGAVLVFVLPVVVVFGVAGIVIGIRRLIRR